MTPAIDFLKRENIPYSIHEYQHDSSAVSFSQEAIDKLGVPARMVYKTLVAETENGELVVAVLPVLSKLNTKLLAKALGTKKSSMADAQKVERVTGYVTGGVSPLAQKKSLRTVIDRTAKELDQLYVSAGRRGLEIELKPLDLAILCDAEFKQLCQT